MQNPNLLQDIFHSMRLTAMSVISDPAEMPISHIERDSYQLAQLLERTFDIIDGDESAGAYVVDELKKFWRRLLNAPAPIDFEELRPRMTATYAKLWALGSGNERQEIYDESFEIATTVVELCGELIGTIQPAAASPSRIKPRLVT